MGAASHPKTLALTPSVFWTSPPKRISTVLATFAVDTPGLQTSIDRTGAYWDDIVPASLVHSTVFAGPGTGTGGMIEQVQPEATVIDRRTNCEESMSRTVTVPAVGPPLLRALISYTRWPEIVE
jgi:hypothetical protein